MKKGKVLFWPKQWYICMQVSRPVEPNRYSWSYFHRFRIWTRSHSQLVEAKNIDDLKHLQVFLVFWFVKCWFIKLDQKESVVSFFEVGCKRSCLMSRLYVFLIDLTEAWLSHDFIHQSHNLRSWGRIILFSLPCEKHVHLVYMRLHWYQPK